VARRSRRARGGSSARIGQLAVQCLRSPLHQAPDHGREDQLHGEIHLAAGADGFVGALDSIVAHHTSIIIGAGIIATADELMA